VEVLGSKNVYVSTSSERIKNPPLGYRGGRNGAPAALSKNGSEYLAPKGRTMLKPGDRVTVRTPGGGGYGPPSDRKRAGIEHDLARGYITTDGVEDYGAGSAVPKESRGPGRVASGVGQTEVER
jgi:N-methylhydantoinase B